MTIEKLNEFIDIDLDYLDWQIATYTPSKTDYINEFIMKIPLQEIFSPEKVVDFQKWVKNRRSRVEEGPSSSP